MVLDHCRVTPTMFILEFHGFSFVYTHINFNYFNDDFNYHHLSTELQSDVEFELNNL